MCVLVLLRHADDPAPLVTEGRWHGRILDAERGHGASATTPCSCRTAQHSAAEMDAELKNRISHRGQALAALAERLETDTWLP